MTGTFDRQTVEGRAMLAIRLVVGAYIPAVISARAAMDMVVEILGAAANEKRQAAGPSPEYEAKLQRFLGELGAAEDASGNVIPFRREP